MIRDIRVDKLMKNQAILTPFYLDESLPELEELALAIQPQVVVIREVRNVMHPSSEAAAADIEDTCLRNKARGLERSQPRLISIL